MTELAHAGWLTVGSVSTQGAQLELAPVFLIAATVLATVIRLALRRRAATRPWREPVRMLVRTSAQPVDAIVSD